MSDELKEVLFDEVLEGLLSEYGNHYALSQLLNQTSSDKAEALLKVIQERICWLYGSKLPVSYHVGGDGATLTVCSYMIYDEHDFAAFLYEKTGYDSGIYLLEDMLFNFKPESSKLLTQLELEGAEQIMNTYAPSNEVMSNIDCAIEVANMPKALKGAIGKAYFIHSFICESLNANQDDLPMQLALDNLELIITIKHHDKPYEITGINDIHCLMLGLPANEDLTDISDSAFEAMYEKLNSGLAVATPTNNQD